MLDFPDDSFLRCSIEVGVFEPDHMKAPAGSVERFNGGDNRAPVAHGGQHTDLGMRSSTGFPRDFVSCHLDLVRKAASAHNGKRSRNREKPV